MKLVLSFLMIVSFSSYAFAKKGSPEKKAAPTANLDSRKPQQDVSGEESYAESVKATSNCLVTVTTVRVSGASDVQQFYSQAASKEECEKRAKPHRPNLYPDLVKSKLVSVKYLQP